MSNRRRAKSPGMPLGGPHEPSAWMRDAHNRAIAELTELETPPGAGIVIGYLTPNDDTVCDRCGGDPTADGGPCAGIARFAEVHTGSVAYLSYGLCGTCCAKEGVQ